MATEPDTSDMAESKEGVTVPKEFQIKTHKLIHKATKHQLAHVRDRVYQREDEMRKEESKKSSKGEKDKWPEMMSTDSMPS